MGLLDGFEEMMRPDGYGASHMDLMNRSIAGGMTPDININGPMEEPGFWSRFGTWLDGDENGTSPLTGIADALDMLGRSKGPIQSIPHPTPGGQPLTSPGMFSLRDLIAASGRGGWGGGL